MSQHHTIDPYRTETARSLSAWIGRTLRDTALYTLGARQVGTSVCLLRYVESAPAGLALSTHPDGESWPSLIPYLVPAHPTETIRATVTCAVAGDVRLRLVDLQSGVAGAWVDLSTGTHDAELELAAGPLAQGQTWRPIAVQVLSLVDDATLEAATLDEDHLAEDQIEVTPTSLDPSDIDTPCALFGPDDEPLLHITWAEAHGLHYDCDLWPAGAAASLLRDASGALRTDIQIGQIGRIGIESIALDCYDPRPITDDLDTSGVLPAEHAIRTGALVYASTLTGIDEGARHSYITRPRWITADAQQATAPGVASGDADTGTGTYATRSGGGQSAVGVTGAYTIREDVVGLRVAMMVAPAPLVSQAGSALVRVEGLSSSGTVLHPVTLPDWYDMTSGAQDDAAADRLWQVAGDWSRVWYGADASTTPSAYPIVETTVELPSGLGAGDLVAVQVACRDWLGYVLALSVTEIVGVD